MPDETVPVEKSAPRGFGGVLARPQFLLLVIGQTVAQLGDRLHNMALIALVAAAAATATTGVEVSKIGVVTLLPTVFAPVVGALVDRWNKQFTMVMCHLMRALIVAFIPWLYHTSGFIWPVYVVAFFVGVFGVFFNAAKMAVIPDLVQHEELLAANAALTSIGRVATVTGMVGGGLLVEWGGWKRLNWEGWEAGFYTDSVAYLVSVLTLVGITMISHAVAKRQRSPHPFAESAEVVMHEVAHEVEHLRSGVRATFGLIKSHHGLRFVFLMVVVLGMLAGSIFNILTAASIAVLGAGAKGVGFLGGLLAGGMIIGSVAVGTVGARWDKRWMMVMGCLLMGVLMLLGSVWFSYGIFMPIAFAGGAVLAPVMVSMDTLLHEWSPKTSRALVFSTRDTVLGASFIGFSTLAGTSVALLQAVARTPYAVALFFSGLLVILGTLGAASTQFGLRRSGLQPK
jgi:MFS family permease